MSYDSRNDTLAHIDAVRTNLDLVRNLLINGNNNLLYCIYYLHYLMEMK